MSVFSSNPARTGELRDIALPRADLTRIRVSEASLRWRLWRAPSEPVQESLAGDVTEICLREPFESSDLIRKY